MTKSKPVGSLGIFMGRLGCGCDLLQELTRECEERNVKLGRIEALGAVQKARIGFYNQRSRTYQYVSLDCPLEIANLVGNVSLKDGKPFVHAHVTLVDEQGLCHGGHLAPGTIVFACEFVLEAFDGPGFERDSDAVTGLPLWFADKTIPAIHG